MKQCSKCGVEKPLEAYYVKIDGKMGRAAACIECTKKQTAAYRAANPEKVVASYRQYNYAKHNITVEQWEDMFAAQGGVCAACGEGNVAQRRLHIDHDHACCPGTFSCGECIRGLLCSNCNTALGLLGDDLDRIMRLAAYLMSHVNVLKVVSQ